MVTCDSGSESAGPRNSNCAELTNRAGGPGQRPWAVAAAADLDSELMSPSP